MTIIPREFGREQFVALIPSDESVLEIGPFTKPAIRGENVRYFDVLDRNGLVARAIEKGYSYDNPVDIHYVSPAGDLSCIPDVFCNCFSSHTVEHQPDLIRHLEQVSALLRSGGRYFLIIPDKRYCFDHFIPETTIADVIDARGRERHTLANVIRHRALVTHNEPIRHWRGDHGAPRGIADPRFIQRAVQEYENAAGAYVDVHAWQFTPSSFRMLLEQLRNLDLAPFLCEQAFATVYGRFEFCAVLKKV